MKMLSTKQIHALRVVYEGGARKGLSRSLASLASMGLYSNVNQKLTKAGRLVVEMLRDPVLWSGLSNAYDLSLHRKKPS